MTGSPSYRLDLRHTAAKDRTFKTVRPNQGRMRGRVWDCAFNGVSGPTR